MVGFVCGIEGSGKTQRMVAMANAIVEDALGKVVFVDSDADRMFDLKHSIRLVTARDYDLEHNHDCFYGFIAGLIAGDFDIHTVFIDSCYTLINQSAEEMIPLFERLEALSEKQDVRIIIAMSGDAQKMPEYIKNKEME